MSVTCILSDIQVYMEYASSARMGLVHDKIQAIKWLRDQVGHWKMPPSKRETQPAKASRPGSLLRISVVAKAAAEVTACHHGSREGL